MQVSFLGPFEVDGTDGPVTLGGPKERTVLALLALRANEVVSTAQLIEGLWGGHPPATALKTVHGNVARVRRALEAAGLANLLVTKEPGYFLRVEPDCIDAVRFECHLRAARLAVDRGEVERADRELADALALWRGEAFADCRANSEPIAAGAVRLDELRCTAVEDRMELRLALGHHTEIVGELEAMLVRHPLRERLWHSLMVALYRSRRQAEALRAYQRARAVLVDDLGVEPSTLLRDLEGAILRNDPSLDLSAVPARDFFGRTPQPPDPSSARLVAWASSGPAFVGRESELITVTGLWHRAGAGERQVLMIGGEPGIGKTRLAAETCVIAGDEGARVLYGRCDEDLGVPYQPFVEILRAYVESCRDGELVSSLGRYPGELVRLVPELATRVEDLDPPLRSDPATEQYRLFEAVVEWLGAAAARCPCVIVLDDLHWAAPPTVLLLRHVIRSGRFDRSLIIGTYRLSELTDGHPLAEMLADLHMSAPTPRVARLDLSGLNAAAVEQLVETASGRSLDEAGRRFAQVVHRETGGNPFFVGEIVHNALEVDATTASRSEGLRPESQWPDELTIPPAARDVVLRRVARLTEDAQHVLTTAAVAGAEFECGVLEQVVEVDREALLGALEEAVSARVVDEVGSDRFAFTHAIARRALYDRLSASRRLRLHGRVADALERVHGVDRDQHLSELAFHCAEANSVHAVRYAVEAASGALDRLAFEDAVSICTRGLAAVERSRTSSDPVDPVEECDLLLTLGRAELRAGLPTGRDTLLRASELARTLGDVTRQSASVLAMNRGFFSRIGRIDEALVTALEHAIEAQGPDDAPERAELLATLASELVWAPDDRRFELSDLALETARRVGDARTLARVLLLRCMTIQAPDTRDERSALLRELRTLAESLGDPASTFDSAFAYSGPAWESGDVAGMNEMEELATCLAAELRQPRLEWQASFMRAARRLYEGDLVRAEETAEETLALGQRAGQHDEAFIFYNEQILEIRRWQARLGELLDVVGSLAGHDAVDFGYSLTRYAFDAGAVDIARAVYTEKMVAMSLPPRRDMLALTTLHNLAYLAARFSDIGQAHATYEALTPHAAAFTSTTVAKPVGEHFLGMLAATVGDHARAAEHFRNATRAHERASAPLLLAETHVEHARSRASSGAPDQEVSDLLETAREIGAPRGATFVLLGCREVEASGRR